MAVHTLWTADCARPRGRAPAIIDDRPRGREQGDAVSGLDPVAALRRIAFLLERRQADSYRIKAYRGAAATLLGVDADEIRARAEAGTLRQLPGVGAKTAGIIEECVAGEVPGYLAELEATAGPLVEGGEE